MTWLEIILLAIVAAATFPVWFPMLAIMGAFAFAFAVYVGAMLALAATAVIALIVWPFAAVGGVWMEWKRRSKGQSDA